MENDPPLHPVSGGAERRRRSDYNHAPARLPIHADVPGRVRSHSSHHEEIAMKAVVVHQTGGPEVLQYEDRERPKPGPGEVLIKVDAAGVNFIDTYHRTGLYKMPLPFTPGAEAAGTVEEVAPDVTGIRKGDRVASSSV